MLRRSLIYSDGFLSVLSTRIMVVAQFAVAALYERRKLLKNKSRRSLTAATATKLRHHPNYC